MTPERSALLADVERTYREFKGTGRQVREQDTFETLGVDSLLAYEIIVALEDRYGIELIEAVQAASVASVSGLLDAVEGARVTGGRA